MNNAKQVLLSVQGAVLYGVVIETITRLRKGGGEQTVLKIIHLEPETGHEVTTERFEEETLEVVYYNTDAQAGFLRTHGGAEWAKEKVKEFDPQPVPVKPVEPSAEQPAPEVQF